MKIKKGVLIGSIICFIFAITCLCIGLIANNHIFANEKNTTELSGTVVMVEEDEDGYLVLLEGEVVPIRIFFNIIVNEQYMQSLSEGDTIYYSVLNDILDMIQDGNSDLIIPVCSVRSKYGSIVTTDSYNAAVERDKVEIMKISISIFVAFLVVSIVLLFAFIVCLIRNKKAK